MNLHALACLFLGLTAIGYWLWGEWQAARADRLQAQLNEAVATTEMVQDYSARMARRAISLEHRRYVVQRRWWGRNPYRRLTPWNVRSVTTTN